MLVFFISDSNDLSEKSGSIIEALKIPGISMAGT